MDSYDYQGIDVPRRYYWQKSFLRQVFVCSGVWTSYFMSGMCLGAPTVTIPQMRKEANSTDAVSEEMASWISSIYGISAVPWTIILPIIAAVHGRRIAFLFVSIICLGGFIAVYFSNTAQLLLLSLSCLGVLHGTVTSLTLLVATEYTSPRYRGALLTIKSASYAWGIWASNVIGTFFHWNYIFAFGIICAAFSTVCIYFWPESPYWLASKGMLDTCAKSHIWLKGTDEVSNRELDVLLKSTALKKSSKNCKGTKLQTWLKQSKGVFSKGFYMPIFLSLLMFLLFNSSGKLVCSVYAIDIIKSITNSEFSAYAGMLILDLITIISMYVGVSMTRYFNRRVMMFVCSSVGFVFLFVLSLYLYLISLSIISENKYVSIALITAFSMALSAGPLVLSTSIVGELIPLKCRNFAVIVVATLGNGTLGVALKLAPYIFKSLKLHGAFLTYGIITVICTSLLYIYLPETKDKTLQEIADSMKEKTDVIEEKELVNLTEIRVGKNTM